jgi:chorismate dehydratase
LKKIRISAVSYTNTKPFLYGLQHTDIINQIDLSLDIPADCAQKLIDDQVDIGLIPVAATLNLPEWHLVSDYCIGAVGAVNSVFIFSNCPIDEVEVLQLDPQSRSSNNLARVLLQNYWKLKPKLVVNADDYSISKNAKTAFVQIGDRTFGKADSYAHVYDLAEEWTKFTGLPFTFAAWIANKPIPQPFINTLNQSLQYGLDHREELFKEMPMRDDFDIKDYLTRKIDYPLTDDKRKALHLFLDYIKELI